MPKQNTVNLEGTEYPCYVWPAAMFKRIFLEGRKSLVPESPEDWKALVWLYNGPKPSQIERVIIKPTADFTQIVMAWELKK